MCESFSSRKFENHKTCGKSWKPPRNCKSSKILQNVRTKGPKVIHRLHLLSLDATQITFVAREGELVASLASMGADSSITRTLGAVV